MELAAGVIPARYGSTRFPGKPLALIKGRPMIQWVYEAARRARYLERVIVATDDERIAAACRGFGAEAVMTSPDLRSGTERAAEVSQIIDNNIIINIQGDEPLLSGGLIDRLVEALQDPAVRMASLMRRETDLSLLADPNRVKVVVDKDGWALYFSRSGLPSEAADYFFQHIGIYGYRKELLREFCAWPPARLERMERLEQLRALENGVRIKMVETDHPALSVDVPRDIIGVERFLDEKGR
ncbi:MAG: 3-deoxy-manno-octulosonate cytidylyltransferase [Candidatus Aminicenantes bacterium]|nr:3-deoxy-manno-octulosonate cytidylyltransferase [Candidatus Aminicenantes bacterium]